jgi:adenylate cyclase
VEYSGLAASYWAAQISRIEELRSKIAARDAIAVGRVVPDDEDLAIGTGRRLTATVLFIDLSGFTQRPSATAAEQDQVLRMLNLFFSEMIRVIEDYGGTVEKNTGDGLMAYFEDWGAGTPGGNSVQRAVACALTMEAANALLIAPILRASGITPIEFRSSMDYGPVTIARIGVARRFNANVAIGNAANFAAKSLSLVKPGQVGLGAFAISLLPLEWRYTWTSLAPVNTGWVYTDTNIPYPLYLFTGRWARLVNG